MTPSSSTKHLAACYFIHMSLQQGCKKYSRSRRSRSQLCPALRFASNKYKVTLDIFCDIVLLLLSCFLVSTAGPLLSQEVVTVATKAVEILVTLKTVYSVVEHVASHPVLVKQSPSLVLVHFHSPL